jgi:hypothetical protein
MRWVVLLYSSSSSNPCEMFQVEMKETRKECEGILERYPSHVMHFKI